MRPYLAVLSARFRMLLQYRAAAVAGLATQIFWGLIRMMIFIAFFDNAINPPMNLGQVITYVWLGQAFLLLMILGPDSELQRMINSGNIAYELLRPVDLYGLIFTRTLAGRVAPMCLRAGPILLLATLPGWLHWPTLWSLAAFAISIIGAILLCSAVGALMTVSMFWTISGAGVVRIISGAAYFLSGLVVPLPLFPESLQRVLYALPFRGLADIPFRLFTGNLLPSDLWRVLAQQLGWTVALVLFGRWLLGRALRRVVVQGG